MKIGDLIRIKPSKEDGMAGYFLHVIEIARDGIGVVVLSDCRHQGARHFLPYCNRDFEIISRGKFE